MGARRLAELFARYGRDAVEAAFDAILDATTETYRREILGKIPDGTYVWEDYAEHDGVDEPQLHTQRITLTKPSTGGPGPGDGGPKLIIDFTGTGAAGQGPDQPLRRLRRRQLPSKWLAPILRNLADTPERMAELDVNEGVVPLHRDALPGEGHAAHADLPGADERPHLRHPAAARRAGRGGGQGGRRPDAGRPGDHPLHRRLRARTSTATTT